MNVLLWILQILLALHTAMGAVWKFSHSAEQTMPSLKKLAPPVWHAMGVVELLCSVCLVLPLLYKPAAVVAPVAAIVIGAEMLLFCGLNLQASDASRGPIAYWLVVAVLCTFIAWGRLGLRPL